MIDADFGGKQAQPTEPDNTVDMIPLTPSKPSSAPKTQPKPDQDKPTQPAVKWDQGIVYVEGDQARFEGSLYEAKWWTRANVPSDSVQWKRK
ncbi:carbohydrate-binding protein [Sporosarcina ureae]|uniref:carbohydrate-binding protein n=1 Tax=Sporosarcina ureae TaxID=1571 RepID=UPI0026ECF39B|nr:carbohydrate-binding protein [Sporosarcina ureae]